MVFYFILWPSWNTSTQVQRYDFYTDKSMNTRSRADRSTLSPHSKYTAPWINFDPSFRHKHILEYTHTLTCTHSHEVCLIRASPVHVYIVFSINNFLLHCSLSNVLNRKQEEMHARAGNVCRREYVEYSVEHNLRNCTKKDIFNTKFSKKLFQHRLSRNVTFIPFLNKLMNITTDNNQIDHIFVDCTNAHPHPPSPFHRAPSNAHQYPTQS